MEKYEEAIVVIFRSTARGSMDAVLFPGPGIMM